MPDRSPLIGVATLDDQGTVLAWNRDVERLLNLNRRNLKDLSLPTLFPPSEQDRLREFLRRCASDDADCTPEIFSRETPVAEVQRIELRVDGLHSGEGSTGTTLLLQDVTERERSEAAFREESHVIETINRVGQSLSAELDLRKLVQQLTDAATEITGAQFGAFFYNVTDPHGESYMLYTLSGVPREAFSKFPMPRNTDVFYPTFSGEGIVRSDDITKDPRYGHSPPHFGMPEGHLPVRSYLAVPVLSRSGDVLGGLFFGHSEAGRFRERHERILAGIASQAAVAIDNARLYQQAREAEERLRQQLDFNTAITHNMSEGIYTLDALGSLTYMNPAAERMLGWAEADLHGKNIHEVIHYRHSNGSPYPGENCPLLDVIRTGQPIFNGEDTFIRKDGSMFPVSVTSSPILKGDAVTGAVLSFRDLTERKQAEEGLRNLATRARCILWSAGVEENGGRFRWSFTIPDEESAQEVLPLSVPPGRRYAEAWLQSRHPDDIPQMNRTSETALRAGKTSYSQEYRCINRKGVAQWLYEDVSLEPLGESRWQAVAVCMDVTERKRLEAELLEQANALQSSESKLRALFENTSEAILIADDTGTYLDANTAASEVMGAPLEEIIGRNILDFAPPEFSDAVRKSWEEFLREGEQEGEFPLYRPDGGIRHLEYRAKARFYPGHHLSVLRDVTDRKRMEEAIRNSEEQFRTLVEQSPLSVQILSPEGRTLQVNAAWEKLWGIRVDQLGDYNILEDPQLIEKGIMPYVRKGFEGEATEIPPVKYDPEATLPGLQTDSYIRWVRAYIYPVRDREGQITKVVLIHEDVSERQRLENELRRRAEELAEEARRKDNFLAMLAHELRNPLAPTLNAVHIMKMQGGDDPILVRAQEVVERQVHHMARLINDLLDLSRINRGKITLQTRRLDLRAAVERAAQSVRPLIDARHHELILTLPDDPLTAEADPDRLEQILTNLLNNAAKYTEPGGRIEVIGERAGEEAVLRVKDTGIGIEPEVLPHVFDLFSQADRSLDRSRGGLGIGLTLVKNLVRMHGGTVEAHSPGPGKGSEFIVRLPALSPETPVLQTGAAPPARLSRTPRDILLIEDNPDGREMLKGLLEMWGHRLRVASDGPTGVECALADPPEVALIDIGLPKLDGYGVARRIREEAGERRPFLVALTGYGQPEARRRVKEAGFDAHLVKPVDPVELSRLLETLTQESAQE